MDPREHLRALVAAAPAGTMLTVPRDWLAAVLDVDEATVAPVDQTVLDLASRYRRSPSTVRGWCEQGKFPGAYRLAGREWRVPAAGVAAFDAAERTRKTTPKSAPPRAPMRGRVVDLGDWRKQAS